MYRMLRTLPWDQISSWPELEAVIGTFDSEQARGEAFEEFCHAYFKIQSQLYQIREVWRFRNIPPRLLERLGTNTRQDKGIDGVLVHEDETVTAYQAKFRLDRSSVPSQRELSTFYMVSDRADYRLIISNVDDLPVVVKERKDHGQILVDTLLELDQQFFVWLADLSCGTSAPVQPSLEPRPYQVEALTNIVAGLNTYGRGQAILACGAGKTLIGKWVCDSLGCDTALVMVPSLALIRQTLGEWYRANTKPFQYLCVCSDSTVDAQSDDAWIVNPSDLDCRVTTSCSDVVAFLQLQIPTTRIVFCTYQSGEVLATALKADSLSQFSFDLAICDEAHRLAGLSTKTFNHILKDDSIRARKRLFMTATPKLYELVLKPVKGQDRVEVFSMDDANIFGPILYRFGFQKAIEEKVICDYQIVVIGAR
jgi:predicted helicase